MLQKSLYIFFIPSHYEGPVGSYLLEMQDVKSHEIQWKTDVKFITLRLMYLLSKLMLAVGLEL